MPAFGVKTCHCVDLRAETKKTEPSISRATRSVFGYFAVDACRFVASDRCEEGCDRARKTVLPLEKSKAARASESRRGRDPQPLLEGVSGVYEVYDRQLSGKKETEGRGVCRCGVGARLTVPERFVRRSRRKKVETGNPTFETDDVGAKADAETRAKDDGRGVRGKCYKRNWNRDCGKPGKPRGEETSRALRRLVLELLDLLPRVRLVAAASEHKVRQRQCRGFGCPWSRRV
jgi:hypothetical protein